MRPLPEAFEIAMNQIPRGTAPFTSEESVSSFGAEVPPPQPAKQTKSRAKLNLVQFGNKVERMDQRLSRLTRQKSEFCPGHYRDRPGDRRSAGRSRFPPVDPSASYRVGTTVHPSWAWLATKASPASRWAWRLLNSWSSPSSVDLRV